MTHQSSRQLLESVVKLTEQKDQHSLEVCLLKTMHELISAEAITFYEIYDNHGEQELRLVAGVNRAGLISGKSDNEAGASANIPLGKIKALSKCMKTQKSVVLNRSKDSPRRVIHPVSGPNGVFGFLFVECEKNIPKDQELVSNFLRIYHNYLLVLNDNERDTLTGLLNRKTFNDKMSRIVSSQLFSQRRASDKSGACLAILDIDHFKRINDKFGHLYGDEVLLLFSRLMNNTFRETDMLFRFGGEEFVVILREVDMDSSMVALERFRKAMEAYDFPQVGKVTVSIGAIQITGHDIPPTMIDRADQALYYAKNNGRNQVCYYEKLVAEGKLAGAAAYEGEVELF